MEIIFLTKRPESAGATAQVQTQRWLQSKGFALPSVFVVQGREAASPPRSTSTSSSTIVRRIAWMW